MAGNLEAINQATHLGQTEEQTKALKLDLIMPLLLLRTSARMAKNKVAQLQQFSRRIDLWLHGGFDTLIRELREDLEKLQRGRNAPPRPTDARKARRAERARRNLRYDQDTRDEVTKARDRDTKKAVRHIRQGAFRKGTKMLYGNGVSDASAPHVEEALKAKFIPHRRHDFMEDLRDRVREAPEIDISIERCINVIRKEESSKSKGPNGLPMELLKVLLVSSDQDRPTERSMDGHTRALEAFRDF